MGGAAMATYNIPVCNIQNVREKLATIKKKCEKYGCDFSYSEGESFVTKQLIEVEYLRYKEVDVRVIPVEVEGIAKVNGWEFLAVIEHHEKGNIIKTGELDVDIPEKYKTCGPWCEHCKRIRSRKDSYLVRNTETGEIKQVGKACLKEFTNGLDADWAAHLATYINETRDYFEGGCYRTYSNYVDLEDVLALATVVVNKFGYVKVKNDFDEINSNSTKNKVEELLNFRSNSSFYEDHYPAELYDELEKMSEAAYEAPAIEKAKDVKNYFMNLTKEEIDGSEYLRNLYILLSDYEIERKNVGLAVSAVASYKRHLEGIARKEEQEKKAAIEKAESNYIGEIGERITFNAKINLISSWENYYGCTFLYKMKDECGNILTCFATSPLRIDDEDREKIYKVAGTVKKHEEYKGVKQTIVQRCKIK